MEGKFCDGRWRLQGWKGMEDLVDGMESGLPSFHLNSKKKKKRENNSFCYFIANCSYMPELKIFLKGGKCLTIHECHRTSLPQISAVGSRTITMNMFSDEIKANLIQKHLFNI